MALAPAQRDALTLAHQNLLADIRARLTDYATTLWGGLGSWRDTDVNRFVALMVPRVLAGQQQVANITDAYIAQLTSDGVAGRVDTNAIRGVPDDQLYRRPAATLYGNLADGKTLDQAQKAATTRLVSLVATGLQMTQVRQAHRTMARSRGVKAYRRVLRGPGDCALCIVASTQRYWKRDLLPIHPGCDCGVAPLGIGDHIDQVLDPAQLDLIHTQVQGFTGTFDPGARAPDYRKLIVVRVNGEIGPVLTWKHQSFTGPADIA